MSFDLHPQLLRALAAVIETGSMTAASERLGFTQSALSKQISTLEAAVGVQLFRRGPRGAEPTDAAHRLARRAAVVLDQLDAAERDLRDLGAPLQGRVALGGFPTAAMHLVPSALARVQREHPGVEFDFLELYSPMQIRRLRAGRLDLAIVAVGSGVELDLTGLEYRRLASGPLLLAVSEQHHLAGRLRVHVDELRDEGWIAARGTRGEAHFGAWPTLERPTITAELGDWSTKLAFVAAGLGITSIPSLAERALPPGVKTLEVDDPAWEGRSMLIAHVGQLSAAAEAVSQAISSEAHRAADRPRPPAHAA